MASTTGIRAGRAFVVIEALDKTGVVLNKIANSIRAWGQSISMVGQNTFFKSLMAMTPAALGLSTYIKFDDIMRRIQGRTGTSAKGMETVRDAAKNLGKELGYTAIETGLLMDELAQKGFNPAEILATAPSVLKLARSAGPGTDVDTRQSADLISGLMNSYGMERTTANAEYMAHTLSKAANISNYSIEELTETMKNMGTVGAQFKMPIPELLSMAAVLRDVNIQSESVGIASRNIWLRLSDKSLVEKFSKQLKEVTGYTLDFVKANGDLHSVPTILENIGQAMEGLGTQQTASLMDTLIGDKAIVAGMRLSKGAKLFKDYAREISAASEEKFADKSSATMNAGPGGMMRKLTWMVVNLSIAYGEVLAPAMMKVGSILMDVGQSITEFIKKNAGLVVALTLLLPAAAAVGVGLMLLGVAINLLGIAFLPIAATISASAIAFGLLGKVLWMTVAGTRAITIGFLLQKIALVAWKAVLLASTVSLLIFRAACSTAAIGALLLQAALTTLPAVASAAKIALTTAMGGIRIAITSVIAAFDALVLVVAFAFGQIASGQVLRGMQTLILGLLMPIHDVANALFDAAFKTVLWLNAFGTAKVYAMVDALVAFTSSLFSSSSLALGFGAIINGVTAAISMLLSPMGLAIVAFGVLAYYLFTQRESIFEGLQIVLSTIWTEVQRVSKGVTKFFSDAFSDVLQLIAVLQIVGEAVFAAFAMGDFAGAWALTLQTLHYGWLLLTSRLKDGWRQAMNYISEIAGPVIEGIGEAWSAFSNLFEPVVTYIGNLWSDLCDMMVGNWGSANSSFLDIWYDTQAQLAKNMLSWFQESGENERGDALEQKLRASRKKMGISEPTAPQTAEEVIDDIFNAKKTAAKEKSALRDRKRQELKIQDDQQITEALRQLLLKAATIKENAIAANGGKMPGAEELFAQLKAQAGNLYESFMSLFGAPSTGGMQSPLEPIQGLQQGSLEAAKQAYKNQQNQMGQANDPAAKALIEQQKTNKMLEDIKDVVTKIDLGELAGIKEAP